MFSDCPGNTTHIERPRLAAAHDAPWALAHAWCAQSPLFYLAQALLIDDPPALSGHAIHVQVVQQQRLCVLAQSVGLDHALCKHTWVLSTEEELDPRDPVLGAQEWWPSWRSGRGVKRVHSQALWVGVLASGQLCFGWCLSAICHCYGVWCPP